MGTIFAQASGAGRAGVAVLRVSGPEAGPALARLTGREPPPARRLVAREFRSAPGAEVLDRGLAAWFPGPASFTGEDVVELHLHGGRAVIADMLAALGQIPGLRLAEPGEFTRRAFQNGKLDLTAAEGLADLVAAETAAQRRQALRQLGGALSAQYDAWRQRLIELMARVEADIDFPDEDLPDGVVEAARAPLAELAGEIAAHLADARRGEVLREGVAVAILGAPNAGKSSLLNALVRREAAIVSEISGTTRDVIEATLDLDGYPVILADTAGLGARAEKIEDPVEAEGVRRALARARQADLRLVVVDGAAETPGPDVLDWLDRDALLVLNKADLPPGPAARALEDRGGLVLSATSGEGLAELRAWLAAAVAKRFAPGAGAALTRERHRQALTRAVEALARAEGQAAPELLAEELRLAAREIGRITGRVDVEDVLDVVFAEFCIGK